MTVEVSDVEKLDSTGWQSLDFENKVELLEDAKREKDTLYSGLIGRMPTLEGDEDIFVKNLAAHKFELAEGGEPQSQSQTGGSTNYSQGNPEEYLELTRYGRTALRHIREEQSISIVRTW